MGPTIHYQAALNAAVDAALEAGKLLRAESQRPGGPRGSGGHADVDEQAEQVIRKKILAAFPAAYRGEETGSASGGDTEHIWLVDPNDGTSAYLKGWRGSAVSIALVRQGALVLGVVYAPTYPDDNGDMFAWAEGCGPVTRNGTPVTTSLADKDLKGDDDVPAIVFISQDADKNPAANAACVAPARLNLGRRRGSDRDGGRRHRHERRYCRSPPGRRPRPRGPPAAVAPQHPFLPPAPQIRHGSPPPHRVLAGRCPSAGRAAVVIGITSRCRQGREQRAVNLGDDADTTGAVCGQLAGAYWGESGIPGGLDGLARRDLTENAVVGLLTGKEHS